MHKHGGPDANTAQPENNDSTAETPVPKKRCCTVGLVIAAIALTEVVTAGIIALLANIIERQEEAGDSFAKVVDLDDTIADPPSGARTSASPSRSDYRGRPVWLLFQATWCSICRAELPDVEEAADDIDIVAIYLREDRGLVTDYAERFDLTIRNVPDPICGISLRYLANSVLTHYFIAAEGNVASILKGAVTAEEISAQPDLVRVGAGAEG